MAQPLSISVALATYNGERFLREQLDSLASQTVLPAELVVCDDGSTDGTLDVLDDWAKTAPFPVRVHRNPQRLGFADNFLRAASLCQGDLIGFCDQDDVWLKEKLAHCREWFETDNEVMLVSHNAWVADRGLTPSAPLYPSRRTLTYGIRQFRLWDAGTHGFTIVARAGLVCDRAWTSRPSDLVVTGSMPHDHWLPFLASVFGKVVLDRRPLALYRQHGANAFGADGSGAAATNPLRERQERCSDGLVRMQALTAEWAATLAALAAQASSEQDGQRLRTGCEWYQGMSRRYAARARLYESGLGGWERAGLMIALARIGGYRHPKNGGLGVRPLVRDLVAVGSGGMVGQR